ATCGLARTRTEQSCRRITCNDSNFRAARRTAFRQDLLRDSPQVGLAESYKASPRYHTNLLRGACNPKQRGLGAARRPELRAPSVHLDQRGGAQRVARCGVCEVRNLGPDSRESLAPILWRLLAVRQLRSAPTHFRLDLG